MITDHQYLGFMNRLAEAVRGKNGLVLTDWENQFLGSFLQSSRPSLWFTPGRRVSTERMWATHGPEIGHPHPLDTVTERPKMADADPTGCEYLIREENGPQRRCNEPATCREPRRLRYCAEHRQTVEQAPSVPAHVVCTYYDTPLIRSLYPAEHWHWQSIASTKNSCLTRGNKVITNEFVLTKLTRPQTVRGHLAEPSP